MVKPDTASSYYNGPGEYLFKVGRYTPSCSSASVWSAEETIAITGPTPTPTSSPTNTPIPTAIPTSTPTPKLASTPTSKPTPKLSPTILEEFSSTGEGVLGESSQSAKVKNSKIVPLKTAIASDTVNNLLPKILILVGIVFLVACAIVVFYPYLKELRKKNLDE
jgi:hypothetical protein